jgi:hypothetical protein
MPDNIHIPIGARVREVGDAEDDAPIGECVRARPGAAGDDRPRDEKRVSIRWEQGRRVWTQRHYVSDLVIVEEEES